MSDTGSTAVLRARGLRRQYGKDDSLVRAVDGIDLDVAPGETVAVGQQGGSVITTPPFWWLAAVVAGTVVVVTVLTAVSARIGARRPVAGVLQAE